LLQRTTTRDVSPLDRMRYQGKLTNWKDEEGFGFVAPNGGGRQVFVHIKSFSNRQRRPTGNELVTYELTVDSKGRAQGENVAFVGDSTPRASTPGPGIGSLTFAALFLAFVTGAAVSGRLPFAVIVLYLVASAVAFCAYALDKSAARNDGWRTRESTLHVFGLAGGWPGALLAQKLLRHKSQKQSFKIVFWVTVILNCGVLGWLFLSPGSRALESILGVA
jgi:uncharacterized membrane protein YsdA (DUF1294 family)/cold shock CspA family protein